MSRRLVLALSTAGVAGLLVTFTLAVFVHGYGPVPWWRLTLDLGVGASFLGAGLIAWWRRPKNDVGRLLMAAGFAFVAGAALSYVESPVTYTVRWLESSVYLAILAQLLFAFPSGRMSSRLERVLCTAAYVDAVFGSLTVLIFVDPRTRGLPQGLNLLLLFPNQQLFNLADSVLISITVALTLVILAVFVRRWGRASAPARRIIAPVGWSLALVGLAFVADTIVSRQPSFPSWTHVATAVAQTSAVMLVPLGFLVGLLRSTLARSAVGDLVIELGETPPPGQLREMLAHTLHDPSLRLAYWIPEVGAYVDAGGATVTLPAEGSGQVVVVLQHEGERVGVLVHDAVLIEEPRLVGAVAAATGLAVQNERLQAALRAQLEEIRASRARIVEAADAERRRIERDLHDGAQQRLVGISLALRLASSRLTPGADPEVDNALGQASQELAAALSDLRELAHGIHPAILTEEGLGPALESLVERASVRVTLKTVPTHRLPAPVEAAAYFVVSEALANVAKYARATCATISATAIDERLVVEVSDDGIGGADPTHGSGLRGLADRVAALDGSIRIESAGGKGTVIHAEIPCA
jgi:signal transduction histidine kinase